MFNKVPIILFFLIALSSCSKKQEEIIYQPLEKTNPYELYKEGLASFEKNSYNLIFFNCTKLLLKKTRGNYLSAIRKNESI